jgi:hypothetical protein
LKKKQCLKDVVVENNNVHLQICINLKQFQSVDTFEIKGIVFERNADEINRLTSKTGSTVHDAK